jgi:uncharacterized protein YchJ
LQDFKSLGEFLQLNILEEEAKRYSPINLIDEYANRILPLFVARAGLDSQIINESRNFDYEKAMKFIENINKEEKIKMGRNDPCPCGGGKKYKKCCGK